jgi:hypothetical protein
VLNSRKTIHMERVINFLLEEGFADNVKAAVNIYEAMSDEWLDSIEERYRGGEPLPPADQKALENIRRSLYGPGGPYNNTRGIKSKSEPKVTLGDKPKNKVKERLSFEER